MTPEEDETSREEVFSMVEMAGELRLIYDQENDQMMGMLQEARRLEDQYFGPRPSLFVLSMSRA